MEVEALLDTGSLAGDIISEDVVVRCNLNPAISVASYTVCSGLDNKFLRTNTIFLLVATFFNERKNNYDTFDIEEIILKSTPTDLIIARTTIERCNHFNKVPSQLGGKPLEPSEIEILDCPKTHCGCAKKPPLESRPRTLTIPEP